jgi:GR25 family glycosyltransferase involved in LPS biosynthesis
MNEYLRHVYVINRDIDVKRMSDTQNILVNNNIKFKRIKAVTIDKIEDSHLTNEIIGCALSHMKIWKKIVDDDLDNAVIFEDDMFLIDDWKNVLNKGLKELPDDWDIFTLGNFGIKNKNDIYDSPFNFIFYCIIKCLDIGCNKSDSFNDDKNKYNFNKDKYNIDNKDNLKNIVKPYFFTGLYGYAISKKGAKKLINIIKSIHDIKFHIDVMISMLHKELNIYSLNKDIVYQRLEQSTINTNSVINNNRFKLHFEILNKIDSKNIKYDYYMNVPIYKLNIAEYEFILNGWCILVFIFILILVLKMIKR